MKLLNSNCKKKDLKENKKENDLFGFLWNILIVNHIFVNQSIDKRVEKFSLTIDVSKLSFQDAKFKVSIINSDQNILSSSCSIQSSIFFWMFNQYKFH